MRQPRRHEPQRRGAPRAGRSLRLVCSWASYRRAITRACEKAFPPPANVVAEGKAAVRAWRKVHAWHPHQLRHTAGTRIRREFGLEAAAATLGHSSAKLTDEVYAERDMQRVAEVMKRMG